MRLLADLPGFRGVLIPNTLKYSVFGSGTCPVEFCFLVDIIGNPTQSGTRTIAGYSTESDSRTVVRYSMESDSRTVVEYST